MRWNLLYLKKTLLIQRKERSPKNLSVIWNKKYWRNLNSGSGAIGGGKGKGNLFNIIPAEAGISFVLLLLQRSPDKPGMFVVIIPTEAGISFLTSSLGHLSTIFNCIKSVENMWLVPLLQRPPIRPGMLFPLHIKPLSNEKPYLFGSEI